MRLPRPGWPKLRVDVLPSRLPARLSALASDAQNSYLRCHTHVQVGCTSKCQELSLCRLARWCYCHWPVCLDHMVSCRLPACTLEVSLKTNDIVDLVESLGCGPSQHAEPAVHAHLMSRQCGPLMPFSSCSALQSLTGARPSTCLNGPATWLTSS